MRLISLRWLIRRSFTYFYADQEFHQCDGTIYATIYVTTCRTKTAAKTLQVKTTTREVTSWENTAGKMQRRRPQGPNQQDMAPQRIDDMDTAIRAKLCLHQEIPWSRQSPRQTTLSQRIRAFPHVKRNVALPTTYKNHEFRHHALQHEQLAEGPPHHT